MSRFDYVKYDQESIDLQNQVKAKVESVHADIKGIYHAALGNPQEGYIKERALSNAANAVKALEEFYMWTGKLIKDAQILRVGLVELQEERKDG